MTSANIPDLEERFLEPEGWRWHKFKRDDRTIRFGSVFPQDKIPDAVVVCLPGLSEFSEKYFETARSMLKRNFAFWVIDWMGQGRSSRYLKNPHKRHSTGFDEDVEDLHKFILGYIKHSSVHPDVGRIPMVMLGHSMGANIGLNYMHKYPDIFECAALMAPMFGLRALHMLPAPLAVMLTWFFKTLSGRAYVHGGADWRQEMRPSPGNDSFSSDPVRGAVHNAWCLADPDLQVGRITYGWLYQATKSCARIQKHAVLSSIKTPCLLTLSGHEDFVDNSKIRHAASLMPNAKLLEFPDARHEILMEKDETRKLFLEAFYQMVKEHIIDRPETLKPF